MRNLDLLRHLSTKVSYCPAIRLDASFGGHFAAGRAAVILRDGRAHPGLVAMVEAVGGRDYRRRGAVCAVPVLAFVALAIRLDSEGPDFLPSR